MSVIPVPRDGTREPAPRPAPGDEVPTPQGPRRVLAVHTDAVTKAWVRVNGADAVLSTDHPVHTARGPVCAHELRPGDRLVRRNAPPLEVLRVDTVVEARENVALEIEGDAPYWHGEWLVASRPVRAVLAAA